jgi:plasmid replication initiation protein
VENDVNNSLVENADLLEYNVNMSNELIRASHGLTLVEKRVIAIIIAKIDSRLGHKLHAHLSEFQKLKLTAIEYMNTYDVDSGNAYIHLKKAANHLLSRQIRFYHNENGKKRYTRFNWLSSATYAEQEGFIELSFTSEVYPHLNALKREYTQYRLKNAAALRSSYSWRLYELAKSWLSLSENKGKPITITLAQLRQTLDVPDTYRWDHMRKRAIDPAIKEIYKINKLHITYEIRKKGRRVHALDISIAQHDQIELPIDN